MTLSGVLCSQVLWFILGLKSSDPLIQCWLWLPASTLDSHQFTFRIHLCVFMRACVCFKKRGQGVGGRPEASLGKHKLQTAEITGVQTGRDPERDPEFHRNPPPHDRCLLYMQSRRKKQWWKTENKRWQNEERDKRLIIVPVMALLMWLREIRMEWLRPWRFPQRDIPVPWVVFSGPRLSICRMFTSMESAVAASCIMTHYSASVRGRKKKEKLSGIKS